MRNILEPILLGQLMDEMHLDALSKATGGREASTILLAEPTMRDFGIVMGPREDRTDEDHVQREAFMVVAVLRDADGNKPLTIEQYLDDLPASTGAMLSTIATTWLMQVQKEAHEGLGKRMKSAGLSAQSSSASATPKSESSS